MTEAPLILRFRRDLRLGAPMELRRDLPGKAATSGLSESLTCGEIGIREV